MTDTIQRSDITTILNIGVRLVSPTRVEDTESLEYQAWRHNHLMLVQIGTDKPLATVSFDDLFDADGNRFSDNRKA